MRLNPLNSRMVVVSFLGLLLALSGCPRPEVQAVEQTIGQGGGAMMLEDASLDVPAGAFLTDVKLTFAKDKPDETVDLTENERAVSGVFVLTHDQDMTVDSAGEPFAIELPFGAGDVPEEDLNYQKVFVKIQIGEEVSALIGNVSPGRIGIVMLGLPPHAAFQVCHNPYVQAVTSDSPPGPKRLTQNPPWQTTQWFVLYDPNDAGLRNAIGVVLNKPPADVTVAEVLQVVKERVANNARDASKYFEGLGLRQPNLEVWTLEGQQWLILRLFPGNDYQAFFAGGAAGNGIGQVRLSNSTIDNPPTFFLGTVRDYLAHETFHACFSGYDFKQKNNGAGLCTDIGYNEGCAVVMGNTFDKGIPCGRENVQGLNHTLMLNNPIGSTIPLGAAYANDDFFAYVGRRFDDNSMRYLGGRGKDSDGDSDGMLEQIRKQVAGLSTAWSFKESFYEAYRVGMDKSFQLQFGFPLATVYWDFARNRAYENNRESQLRSGDNATPNSLNRDRFNAGMLLEHTFLWNDEPMAFLYVSCPALKDIAPLSSRAVVLNTSDITADLDITFNTSEWPVDTYGNSLRVKVYKNGDNGVELLPGADTMRLHLDKEYSTVILLLSNLNTASACSVNLSANTAPLRFVGGNVSSWWVESHGGPLEGATVTARAKGNPEVLATVTTSVDGVFKIADLPDGPIDLTFEMASYISVSRTVAVMDGQAEWILVQLVPDGEGCLSSGVPGRWGISFDEACNGTFDSYNYWNFLEDGTISWVSTGLILQGYEWRMEGDQELVITRPDGSSLVGTFSPDCNRLLNGELVGGFGAPTCWEGFTNDPGK